MQDVLYTSSLFVQKVSVPSPQYKSIKQILLEFVQSLFCQSFGLVKAFNFRGWVIHELM